MGIGTRVVVLGSDGRMGRLAVESVRGAADLELVGCVTRAMDLNAALVDLRPDVAVDFTTPQAATAHLRQLIEAGVHPVIGTTGIPAATLAACVELARARRLGGLIAPNFALGALLMIEFAKRAARYLGDVEILEFHHPNKLDAPSGTALRTRAQLAQVEGARREVPIHSIRLPGFLAHQEVILGAPGERLTIRHDAMDRSCYMPGMLLAIRRVLHAKELVVGLEHFLDLGDGHGT